MFRKTMVVGAVTAVLLASVALADSTSTATSTAGSNQGKGTVNIACIQTAVDKRESAVTSAYGAYTAALQSAFTARSTALHSAWGIAIAKDRNAAIRAAWQAFNTAARGARQTLRQATHSAWNQFRTDRRSCGGRGYPEENEGSDNSL